MTRYFFLHLHKTAGTSLWRRLHHQFTDAELYPGVQDDSPTERTFVPEYLQARYLARRDEIRVVTGHFPLCTTELLGDDFRTFTVLRPPLERVTSVLRHHRDSRSPDDPITFDEIYDLPVQQLLIRNHMTKMLALDAHEMTDGALSDIAIDDARLEVAKQRLTAIDVVGLQSRFEEFCAALEQRFSWDLGPTVVMNRSSSPSEMTPELARRIEADNAIDQELYDFARGLAA